MKFKKTEIDLCKKIAEKYRRDLDYGDWFYSKKGKLYYIWDKTFIRTDNLENWFPLWTIFDCLEFLREKGWTLERHYDRTSTIYVVFTRPRGFPAGISGEGKTDREACLKAILAVLEEKQ